MKPIVCCGKGYEIIIKNHKIVRNNFKKYIFLIEIRILTGYKSCACISASATRSNATRASDLEKNLSVGATRTMQLEPCNSGRCNSNHATRANATRTMQLGPMQLRRVQLGPMQLRRVLDLNWSLFEMFFLRKNISQSDQF